MNANAKEWHPPASPVVSTSMVSCVDNNDKDDIEQRVNGGSKTAANHNTRRRRQHQRTRQNRYGKKNVNIQCQNGDISSTSNNTANTNKVCYNDRSTNTSTADSGMVSPSTQDVHDQSTSIQNHISKHQEHQKQKQRRRRRRKGGSDEKKDDTVLSSRSTAAAGGGSHHTQKVANHRRRRHKKKVNGSATSEKHPDDELSFDNDECNFPTLNTNSTVPSIPVNNGVDINWNDSLANKLASIEIEEQKQKYLLEQLQLEQDMKESVQLTKLTYNKPLHNILDNKEVEVDDQLEDIPETDDTSRHPTSSTEASTHDITNYQTIPNTKHKWTNSELTKMRKRWWDAVRAKRKKVEEERLERRRVVEEKEKRKVLSARNGTTGDMDNEVHYDTDDSSSDDGSSSSSSYSFSSSNDNRLIHTSYDPMEPPSLTSTPFDEMTKPNKKNPRPQTPPIIPYIKPTVSQTILDLEKQSLELDYPLHYAVYIISLKENTNHEITGNTCNGSRYNNDEVDERNKSDGEVVLNRLLKMQSDEDVDQWRSLRVGLSTIRGLEDEESTLETDLLSADVNAMTPLQLAIYLNLPSIIRLLYTTSTTTSTHYTKNNSCDEEDEYGRTPLMLACELNHVECIQTIMCISSPRKLVRREQLGGNTAFHFCCMDRQLKEEGGEDSHDHHHQLATSSTPQCASAFEMLLRYTPIKEQKKILSTTNHNKQNLLHLACNQGDLQLLEILLDCHNSPGVNVAKALEVKNSFGYTPFVSAVASES